MRMTDQTEPTTQNPASALESDLGDIRALLRQAVALRNNTGRSAEARLAAMTAATRLFSAAAKGSEMLARLKGHVYETCHRTIVENHGESRSTAAERAARSTRIRDQIRKDAAEAGMRREAEKFGGIPLGKNLKTNFSDPALDSPGADESAVFDDPEET